MPPPAEGLVSRIVLGPALRTQPDRRLVTLVREGYELAFEEIVRRYRQPLGRYAAAIVGGRSEDVTQDAFSKALLALRRDDSEIDLRPWLYRIVRNTALNDLRDRPAAAEELAETIAGGRTPGEVAEQREELADLMKRLQALPEAQRAAIVMRELEGLSHDEIAAALGLSGSAARQAIYRARQALRDGVGMLFPLPVLRILLEGGSSSAAEAVAGAAGVGGAAGAGVALKATAATVLVAGAVGAGVVLDRSPQTGVAEAPSTLAPGVLGGQGSAPGFEAGQEAGHGTRHGSASTGDSDGERRGPGSGDNDSSGPGSGSLGEERSSSSGPGPGSEGRGGHGGDDASHRGRPGPGGGEAGLSPHGGHGPGSDDFPEHHGGDGSGFNSGPGSGSESGGELSGGGDGGFGGGGSSGGGSGEEASSPTEDGPSGDGGDIPLVEDPSIDGPGPGSLDSPSDLEGGSGLSH
jgi:RNA polymerase sigma factor (sigma-70 family)